MNQKLLLCIAILFTNFAIQAQTISGKVVDINNSKPIENVAIVTNLKTGTTSNKFGEFTLNLKNIKTITFSCLGFETKTINISYLKNINYIIGLSKSINQLNEIKLHIAKVSLDSLLIKTAKNMKENYLSTATKQELFAVENQKLDFKKIDLELKSNSLLSRKNKKLAEQELKEFSDDILYRKPEFISEFKAIVLTKEIQSKKNKKTIALYNIDSLEGYKKADIGNGITIKNMTTKLQNIILKHLNPKITYKIKSGLFKVEDSLSLAEVTKTNDSIEKSNTFSNFRATNYVSDLKNNGMFFNKSSENIFFDRKYYHHQLEKNQVLGIDKYYVISFTPRKSKSKYAGFMFIDPFDFTIKKLIYQFADGKRGQHLNLKLLFGVKFSENKNSVTLFYEKNEENKVYASYYHESKTNYAYINRPLKFIENSKEREKVKFNIKVEINVTESREVFIKNDKAINAKMVKPYTKEDFKKRTTYLTKNEYLNSDWKNRNIIKAYLKQYE